MNQIDLFAEVIASYQKHGWELQRLLLRPETQSEMGTRVAELSAPVRIYESLVDALWFARPSHGDRVAWELRLVAETPYALFETFEADESEEEREDVRREMEARLRHYANVAD